ncbi:MAG: cryptochrome/photolyase family protein [Pseudomonadota bacterium]
MSKVSQLRLVLGDQLNANHSWYRKTDPRVTYLIAELRQETDAVCHHIQTLCAMFKGMELFARALSKAGHNVIYLTLDSTRSTLSLPQLLDELCAKHGFNSVAYQRPDEYRLLYQLRAYQAAADRDVEEYGTEHFLLPFDALRMSFAPGASLRMARFYRAMRKRFGYLMEDGKPAGGQWQFESPNHAAFDGAETVVAPPKPGYRNDVADILARIEHYVPRLFGRAESVLEMAITRRQARAQLRIFCRYGLPLYGLLGVAKTEESVFEQRLYHSKLSFALNAKMVSASELVDTAIDAHRRNPSIISLVSIERFVRQIVGWREYFRGQYWAAAPGINTFDSTDWVERDSDRALSMAEYSHDIHERAEHTTPRPPSALSRTNTGSFSVMSGLDPNDVEDWFLGERDGSRELRADT